MGSGHTTESPAETECVRFSLTQSDKDLIDTECSAGEGSCIYSIAASHSPWVDAIIIMNCEGTSTDDSLIATGSTFHHKLSLALRGIAYFGSYSIWKVFSTCWHRLNSRGDATEIYWWFVSTFITMGTYIITTGKAETGHAISFHSPIMSAFFFLSPK